MNDIRFVHVNLVAKDWLALAEFYQRVFQCELILPERDINDEWLEESTGIENAHIKGAHLRLPGFSDGKGPTLEIFQYTPAKEAEAVAANQRGFGHIAFLVDDVEKVVNDVLENGGTAVGELVKTHIEGVGDLTFRYMRDPEGNIIEVQNWSYGTCKS